MSGGMQGAMRGRMLHANPHARGALPGEACDSL